MAFEAATQIAQETGLEARLLSWEQDAHALPVSTPDCWLLSEVRRLNGSVIHAEPDGAREGFCAIRLTDSR
jgi:hypothetical protein